MKNIDWRNPAVTAAAAAALLIVAGPGYWFYSESRKEAQRETVAQIVGEVTQAVGLAISMRGAEGEATQLDAMVAEAEQRIAALRGAPAKPEPDVFEAAEQYAVDSQRAMRRQAEVVRTRFRTAASQNALMAHMAQSGNRSSEWISEAVAKRRKLEQDYFDFRAAAAAYSSALDAMPATRRQLVQIGLPAPLYDEAALGRVQTLAADDARAATEGLESLKRLPPPR